MVYFKLRASPLVTEYDT